MPIPTKSDFPSWLKAPGVDQPVHEQIKPDRKRKQRPDGFKTHHSPKQVKANSHIKDIGNRFRQQSKRYKDQRQRKWAIKICNRIWRESCKNCLSSQVEDVKIIQEHTDNCTEFCSINDAKPIKRLRANAKFILPDPCIYFLKRDKIELKICNL